MDYCQFENSEIVNVLRHDESIEIDLVARINEHDSVSARMSLIGIKAKALPKPGKLTDGEVFGIPGKPLNGTIPLPFVGKGDYEVELSVEDKSTTIFCKEIRFAHRA